MNELRPHAIVTVQDWCLLSDRARQIAWALIRAFGVRPEDTFMFVLGERSVWFWLYNRDTDGHCYLDADREPAYHVERFDLKEAA